MEIEKDMCIYKSMYIYMYIIYIYVYIYMAVSIFFRALQKGYLGPAAKGTQSLPDAGRSKRGPDGDVTSLATWS